MTGWVIQIRARISFNGKPQTAAPRDTGSRSRLRLAVKRWELYSVKQYRYITGQYRDRQLRPGGVFGGRQLLVARRIARSQQRQRVFFVALVAIAQGPQ